MTSGGGLARVDMSNDDNVNMNLLLTHGEVLIKLPIHSGNERNRYINIYAYTVVSY